MLIGYEVAVGFDWKVTKDAETGLRPLELYLLEQTAEGLRLGTFTRLKDGLPIHFLFYDLRTAYDLSAPAKVEVGPEQQLADLVSERPVQGSIQFRRYEASSGGNETSPLTAAKIGFGPDQSAYLAYSGVNSSMAFARGLYHTWRLAGAPNRLENLGKFGLSMDLTVEGQDDEGKTLRRSFFIDPEIIVEGNG